MKQAAAIGYNKDKDSAPKLLAKGQGHVAQKIIDMAKENDLPIYKDEKLSTQLQNMDLGESIPPELYNVVAEILVFISRVDNSYRSKYE